MAKGKVGERGGVSGTLSIDARANRIGFAHYVGALLEAWGTSVVRTGASSGRVRGYAIVVIQKLLDEFQPTVLLLPQIRHKGFRRSKLVQSINRAVRKEAVKRGITVVEKSLRQVKQTFEQARSGAGRNKVTMNEVIADWFPMLRARLPKPRKLWETEAYLTPMLTAISLFFAWRGLPAKSQRPDYGRPKPSPTESRA